MRRMSIAWVTGVVVVSCTTVPDSPPETPTQPEPPVVVVPPNTPGPPASPNPQPPSTPGFAVNATVEFLDLEGGCWVIRTGTETYLPTNLPAEFKQDGLRVVVRLERLDNVGSICMVGPVVRIVSIQRR